MSRGKKKYTGAIHVAVSNGGWIELAGLDLKNVMKWGEYMEPKHARELGEQLIRFADFADGEDT